VQRGTPLASAQLIRSCPLLGHSIIPHWRLRGNT
jgi:hypothetical protein